MWIGVALLVVICGAAYYFFMPVAEVATVRRGAAISAVYGTVRIEPAFVVHVRAQNSGFIQLAEEFSAGRAIQFRQNLFRSGDVLMREDVDVGFG